MEAGTVLAFDVGTRLIGVAIGTALTGTARPLTTVAVSERGPDWPRIDALLKEWQPVATVVGLPLMLDGAEQAMTKTAAKFAEQLATRSGLVVHRVDERNSSREASQRFAQHRAQGTASRKQAAAIDAVAAAVILDRWFDQGTNLDPESLSR
ncbi:MAG: Holliday junction resolvase RuvX [Dokdonella sp.]